MRHVITVFFVVLLCFQFYLSMQAEWAENYSKAAYELVWVVLLYFFLKDHVEENYK